MLPVDASPRCSVLTVGALMLAFLGAGLSGAASAAESYSSPLREAVRALPVAAETNVGYDRERFFGTWIDADGDCQNTRHEVLIAESQSAPTLTTNSCSVTAGRWVTFYDNQTYTAATQVEIDHMVPASEAWGSGAQAWTQAQRVAFYNDLGYADSLNAMPRALNQAKANLGPEQWLPPANVCRYITAWVAIKIRWAMTVDPAEQAGLIQRADACPNETLTVEVADIVPAPVVPPIAPVVPPDTGPAGPPIPDEPGVKRLAGTDRYSTAAAIVADSFPTGPVPVVFIATGESYADALAGGPAADVLGGPVLPVAKAGIPAPILAELDRLDPASIVILGGSGAVSDALATQLQAYTTGTVSRLAGANRYDTAAKVARAAFTSPVPQVLIATGTGFADALAGGAVGAKTNSPVLLVAPSSLPAETAAALRALQPRNIAVLGGTTAVSDVVLEQLRGHTTGGVTRLAGANRYETAARLSQTFWTTTAPVVYLATGRNFPDALAGVPAAGRDEAPLLLVEPTCMPEATKRELARLQPTTTVVLGGASTVSDAAAAGAICAPPAPVVPANPGDVRDCPDFASQREAQAFFNTYFPYYGDVARLDRDGDRIACEEPTPAPAPAPVPVAPIAAPAPAPVTGVYYDNCTEARAAGAAPIRRGQPGYRSGLDRDNDGIACE